jgi:hypothetical protein
LAGGDDGGDSGDRLVIRSGVMLASGRFSGMGIFLVGELIANIGVAGVFNAESEAVEDEGKLMLKLSWFSVLNLMRNRE